MRYYPDFAEAIRAAKRDLDNYGDDIDPGTWQGIPTEGKPDLMTREVLNWGMAVACPDNIHDLKNFIRPNLPWADLEFEDRTSGEQRNPHHSLEQWPWWQGEKQADLTQTAGKFSHTYSERLWDHAGGLDDLIRRLANDPYGRQAYMPMYKHSDLREEGRVPCSLGWQFMMRRDKLHMWYFIRSCDYVRHFRDDIYLAARLQLWVIEMLVEHELRHDRPQVWVDVKPGYLQMLICSLHYHKGDAHVLSVQG